MTKISKFTCFVGVFGAVIIALNTLVVSSNLYTLVLRISLWLISVYLLYRLVNQITKMESHREE
ncbi:MAG: hypothetical protein NZO16_01355 [Deltaproteobacteria bacterium]|nr:hypothetical protein [Deltaproteobacteria bacterium]